MEDSLKKGVKSVYWKGAEEVREKNIKRTLDFLWKILLKKLRRDDKKTGTPK